MRKKSKLLSLLMASALFVSSLSGSWVSVKADTADAVFTTVTDANGEAQFVMPDGVYIVDASKSGYEYTAGMGDSAKARVTVAGGAVAEELALSLKKYTPTPTVAAVTGSDNVMAPSKEAVVENAYAVSVMDQNQLPMADGTYTQEWSIYPAGTTTPDAAVSVSQTGVVSVTSAFTAEGISAAYDIICKVTANGESTTGKKTITIFIGGVLGVEDLNWINGGRKETKNLEEISNLELPSVYSVTVNLEMKCGTANGVQNLALVSDGGNLAGIQYLKQAKTITAWTGWTGNRDFNQSSDAGKFDNGGIILEEYADNTKIAVTFVIDQANKNITVSCNGGESVSLPFNMSAKSLKSLLCGRYQNNETMTVYDIAVEEPDENYVAINGQKAFAKISGVTVTKDYKLTQAVVLPDEKFEWTVTKKGETQAAAGVSIADGVVSVTDQAVPGDYTIVVCSTSNDKKSAKLDIKIDDYQETTLTVAGPYAFHMGEKGVYRIASAVDQYGDHLPESLFANAVWTSDKADVVNIASATGEAQSVAVGEATLKVELANGTATSKKEVKVVVSDYYLIKDATDGSVTITDEEKNRLVKTQYVVGYQLTATDADGKIVASTEAAEIPGTYTAAGATKVEVAPIFEYAIKAPGTLGEDPGYDIVIPDDTYDFKITDQTAANHERYDIYVNSQMLVNNFLQNATVMNSSIEVKDFVVTDGAAITSKDYSSGKNGSVVDMKMRIVKSPTYAARVQKVYVLGDSLVANYYDGGAPLDESIAGDDRDCYRTGWGQVLPNYMKGVDIVNLANSGITAVGLLGTAFTQVLQSAKPGDLLILESGYNDKTYDTEEIMKTSVQAMIDQATALGVKVILVSPNASAHDYRASVQWAGYMTDVANANKDKVQYIDLSKLSFDFLVSLYGVAYDANGNTIVPEAMATTVIETYNLPQKYAFQDKDDTLHASYRGASKWASLVAGALIDLGYGDIVNTEFQYQFKDRLADNPNTVTCQAVAGLTTAAETASVMKADVPMTGASLENAVKADSAGVYLNEDFESYEEGVVIQAGTSDPAPVTKGGIIYKAGSRGSGLTCSANVKSENGNKYLYIDEDSYATASRGISMTFDAGIPAAADLTAGNTLELSMDITGYSRGVNGNADLKENITNELVGFGEIPEMKDFANVHFRAVIDKTNNKQHIIVTDASGKILMNTSENLTATGFTGIKFYAPDTKAGIDNLKVEQKTSDVSMVTITVKDQNGQGIEGVTLTFAKDDGSVVVPVNKSKLQNLYNAVKDYTADKYVSGWDAFAKARENAKSVLDKETATAEEVENAYKDLNEAKDNLKETGGGVNPPDDSQEPDSGTQEKPLPKGATFIVDKVTYTVTKAGKEVEYTKSNSTAKTVKILQKVKGTDGVEYKITSIGKKAMQNNKKITGLTIGDNVTTIGANAFSGCTKLTSVTFGKNTAKIGDSAFKGCTALKKTVSLPDSVTTIGANAFSGCKLITGVTIGKTAKSKLTTIGKSAFNGCKKLSKVTIKSTKLKTAGNQAFKNTKSGLTVKVPSKKLVAYKKILKKAGLKDKQIK